MRFKKIFSAQRKRRHEKQAGYVSGQDGSGKSAHTISLAIRTPSFWISAVGSVVLWTLFLFWCFTHHANRAGYAAAFVCTALFELMCLRFVPRWMCFWSAKEEPVPEDERTGKNDGKIFLGLLMVFLLVQLLVYLFRLAQGDSAGFLPGLDFWLNLDTGRYFSIAEQGYAPNENLVFFPAYPLLIRFLNMFTGKSMYSALLASALLYAGSGCVMYRLLKLDFSEKTALHTIKYMAILPAAFFFSAPMSESLFLFFCVCCAYFARSGKWTLGCVFGALAAFTRSLGVLTVAFLVLEAVSGAVRDGTGRKQWVRRFLAILLVPLGTLAYLWINYRVTGNPFKFMEYEARVWGQSMGFFFGVAAMQVDNALAMLGTPYYRDALGIWLPNAAYSFSVLILMAVAAKKLRPSYTAWFIVYYVIAMGASFLISAPRYLVAALPIYPALAQVITDRKFAIAFDLASIGLALYYLFALTMLWGVY